MLFKPEGLYYSFRYDNFNSTPDAGFAPLIYGPTAGTDYYNWYSQASGANLTSDVYGFALRLSNTASASSDRVNMLRVGVDPTGGTSYTTVITDLIVGKTPTWTTNSSGANFFFPFFIKAGSQVAVALASNVASINCRCAVMFFGAPSAPERFPVGTFSETLGTTAVPWGTNFTPGANNAWGSWTSLGQTTRNLWWWQLCWQVNDSSMSNKQYWVELAVGDVSGPNELIMRDNWSGDSSERMGSVGKLNTTVPGGYYAVPGGSYIYIRAMCSGTRDAGYNAVAVGIGG